MELVGSSSLASFTEVVSMQFRVLEDLAEDCKLYSGMHETRTITEKRHNLIMRLPSTCRAAIVSEPS